MSRVNGRMLILIDTPRRRVAGLFLVHCSVKFLQLGIVDVRPESIFGCFEVSLVSIRRDLNSIADSRGAICRFDNARWKSN